MSYYNDPEKMLKRYAVMKIYLNPGITPHYPIPLAFADIFNRVGCYCGAKEFKPEDIEHTVQEVEHEDGEYVIIEGKGICSECNAFMKLTKNISGEELNKLKKWIGD